MGTTIEKAILAVVTTNRDRVGGGSPVFFPASAEDLQKTAFLLEKILDGMAHQLDPETMIIVRHQ